MTIAPASVSGSSLWRSASDDLTALRMPAPSATRIAISWARLDAQDRLAAAGRDRDLVVGPRAGARDRGVVDRARAAEDAAARRGRRGEAALLIAGDRSDAGAVGMAAGVLRLG